MNKGTKIALIAITVIGLSVGGYLLYDKLKPQVDGAKPDGGSGSGGSTPSKTPDKPTDMTQGGEVTPPKEEKPESKPAAFGGSTASLGVFPNTVLKKGSGTGNLSSHLSSVKKLQRGLNNLGAGLVEDGKFGSATEAALFKRTGKKTITVAEVDKGLKQANLSDNGKAFERGANFAGIKIR